MLKTSTPSDLSKALILYQPFPGRQYIGRNLVSNTESERKPASKKTIPKVKTEYEKKIKMTHKKPDEKTFNYGKIFLLGIVLVLIVILSITMSSKDWDLCETTFVAMDLKSLKHTLNTSLHGQLLAVKTIVDVLEEFQVTVEYLAVLVLLGGSGTGKTWTTHLIADSLSDQANRVTLHLGPWSNSQEIQMMFSRLECCRWNFVFVEDSDYADSQQIGTLLDVVSTVSQNISCSRRKIVMILTSNYGQKEFGELLYQELEKVGTRSTISQEELQRTASKLISPLINTLSQRKVPYVPVPYLPLEKMQLEQCIYNDLALKKKTVPPNVINKITQHFRFFPPRKEYFVVSGCKTVSSFVNLYS